jgi:hypothetical protein
MSAEGRTNAMWQKPLTLLPAVLVGLSGMGALAPQPALADGAVSFATVTRAGGLYGPRVIALKSAVEKGTCDIGFGKSKAHRMIDDVCATSLTSYDVSAVCR